MDIFPVVESLLEPCKHKAGLAMQSFWQIVVILYG